MVSNPSALSVIDDHSSHAQPHFTAHAADAEAWLARLNTLVQASGASLQLGLGRPSEHPSIAVSRANAGLPVGLRLSRIRGLRGVCRALAASLELVVVTSAAGDRLPTGRFVRNLQARFGIENVSQIVTPGGIQMADVAALDVSACPGATENAAVLPQLFTALWFNGDRAAASRVFRGGRGSGRSQPTSASSELAV